MKLKDYIGGRRRGRGANLLEREALHDPLLAEALEGFEAVEGDHEEVIGRLRESVSERAALERALYRRSVHRARRRVALAGAAAACVLILGGGLLFVMRYNPDAWQEGVAVVVPQEVEEISLAELMQGCVPWQSERHDPTGIEPRRDVVVLADAQEIVDERNTSESAIGIFADEMQIAAESVEVQDVVKVLACENSEVLAEKVFGVNAKEKNAQEGEKVTQAGVKDARAGEASRKAAAPAGSSAGSSAESRPGSSASAKRAGGSVRGQVVDEEGRPLAGATVVAQGTGIAAATDESGMFVLDGVGTEGVLTVSYIGYESVNAEFSRKSALMVTLKTSSTSIDEVVVVTGYAPRTKQTFTGSVTTITKSEIGTRKRARGAVSAEERQRADSVARAEFGEYVKQNIVSQFDGDGGAVTGRVLAEFRVNRRGRPVNIRIIEGLSPDADREARRLIRSGPDWPQTDETVKVEIEFAS